MDQSGNAAEAIRKLLPAEGQRFRLCDAVDAMETFCRNDPLLKAKESEEDDSENLIIVAQRQGRQVEIGLYRSRDLMHRLELLMRYESTWRTLFLRNETFWWDVESDPKQFFDSFRQATWYRRFATLPAATSSVDWHGPDRMAAQYREIIPVLAEAWDPVAQDWKP